MEKPKILFVSQEIYPYTRESSMARMSRYLPQSTQESGKEIRTFMPRYGIINERRNQLHEVIRLSGINMIINDADHPLIIKVASIQAARMQIYFIDNEEFFHKKNMFQDKSGKYYENNDEKCIFFARGVLETVKKLGWTPDIIYCSGWFTSLVPLYAKLLYKDNPIFTNSKIITALYNDSFPGSLAASFPDKLAYDEIPQEVIGKYGKFTHHDLIHTAIDYSDGVVYATPEIASKPWVQEIMKEKKKPVLPYVDEKLAAEKINKFFDKFLKKTK